MLFTLARKYKRVSTLLRSRESQIYSAHPVERLLRILEALSFWHASTYWHVKSLTILLPSSKFGRLVRRKAFLLCKNPCGRAAMGDGGPHRRERSPPAQRNFQRKFALRRVGSYKFVVPPTIESSKVREHARFVTLSVPGSSGCQRGRAPLFPKESRGNPFKGFLWAISSRRLDTALLCAAKKRGVELNQLEGLCLKYSGHTWPRQEVQKAFGIHF